MTLEFRDNAKEETRRHANVLLFGPPKTGKTTGAASAPGLMGYLNTEQPNSTEYAHALDTDGRIKELVIPKDPKPLLSEVMKSCYPKDGEGFDTWVLDSVGELHRRLLVSRSRGAVRPTLDAYGDVAREVEDFCRFMVEAPCNFVIVAHEHGSKDEVSGTHMYLPWTGTDEPVAGPEAPRHGRHHRLHRSGAGHRGGQAQDRLRLPARADHGSAGGRARPLQRADHARGVGHRHPGDQPRRVVRARQPHTQGRTGDG